MKILHISSVPIEYVGGGERVIYELSKRQSSDHQVTILQTNLYMPEKSPGHEKRDKINIITCNDKYFLAGYGFSKQFKKTLKKIWKDYDVVHIHGYGRFTSDYALKYLYGKKPTIFTAHGFFHAKKYSSIKKLHEISFGKLLKKATYCTALTSLDVPRYVKKGVKENKIVIIPNGVDFQRFSTKKDIASIKKKYLTNINSEKKILLYVGRLHESKGINYVLEAIKDIKNVVFLIAGSGKAYRCILENQIKELQITDKVIFTGFVPENKLVNIYQIADAVILYSSWEGFGLTILEAMAAGKPVIASDRGALAYLVKDGITGFLVPYPNVEKLRSKIDYLLTRPFQIKKLGNEAQKFAYRYNWNEIENKYLDLYNAALKEYI